MNEQVLFETGEVRRAAGISDCGRYRYWLTRSWNAELPVVTFIMLNPSTADAEKDDPTIRRCIGFARSWGYGGLCVVNLFALRATDPNEIARTQQPVGEPMSHPLYETANDAHVIARTDGRHAIAAWGCHGTLYGRDRQVLSLFGKRLIECLGTTKEGHPRHPLYVPASATPVPFKLVEASK